MVLGPILVQSAVRGVLMTKGTKSEGARDPATRRVLPRGVTYRGPAQYRARKLVEGARITRTFETARLAREWLEETAAAARRGDHVDRCGLERSTLKTLVDRFVQEELQDGGRRRGATEDRTSHVPSILKDEIAGLKLSKLTPSAIREFRDRQSSLHAPATVVKRLNLLSGMLSHARAEWDVPLRENPATAEAVKRPAGADKKRNRRLMPATPAQVREAEAQGVEPPMGEEERLLAAIGKSETSADLPFVKFAIAQATRRGEALGMRWCDVDLAAKIVTLYGRHRDGTKSDKSREEIGPEKRPMMPDAIKVLKSLLPEEGSPQSDALVFEIGNGPAFSVRFTRMAVKAGILDLHFHDLRHEATSRIAKLFPNPLDLKRVTGHKDLKSLDRYYQLDLTELADRAT